MDKPGKYCCFICPSKDYTEKLLCAPCPKCRNSYGFPLTALPKAIGRYRIVRPLGRGFYAATYLCEFGNLNTRYVLKVSPKAVYEFFGKNFEDECRTHQNVARDTEHIVPIVDYFEEDVEFGKTKLPCYVAVIDFVDGKPLDKYLEESQHASAKSLAQIAIDLFRIWREFTLKHMYHNDLHANNIIVQQLSEDTRRAEALDETIRAVAIDLGSVADASKSDPCELRFGDQHWLCQHLQRMVDKLREAANDIDKVDDLDNRIAEALERTLHFLLPSAGATRVPTADQLIEIVRDYFARGPSPWKEPLKLERFGDSYNAGALEPWYVPFLLVDPDGQWIQRMTAAGPLLITGMRGCGKTMLLRALDLHARAALKDGENVNDVLGRLQSDRYVGLFVSCMNLLVTPGRPNVSAPFERLFLSYCLEAIRAVRHLKELSREKASPVYYEHIADTIETNMETDLRVDQLKSDNDLERFLLRTIASLKKDSQVCTLTTSPADAFESLAYAIRKCSPLWAAARVFFLLDDVSTRYLREKMIETLFSALLFQNPVCAFKVTTEAQTLEIALPSLGLVERAREGRDYDIFDLGADVYKKTKELKRGRKLFIEQVLEQRARYYPNHPNASPREILGDCTLEDIARKIASTSATSKERKAVYQGISALSAVCVGDIGDVINLYELILKKAVKQSYPVAAEIQSGCYLDFCGLRLYDLNRRETDLKNFALTFAEASHDLLVSSHRAKAKGKKNRLRQYTSIYVRVTTGDTRKQFKRLRELIDAGVFVMHGGTPRTKTRDGDPIQQFKLTYRKLFGLSNFIGLAERDRFELSGKQLEEWLAHPEKGKEILLRNLGGVDGESGEVDESGKEREETRCEDIDAKKESLLQTQLLFDLPAPTIEDVFSNGSEKMNRLSTMPADRVKLQELSPHQLTDASIELLVLGLGFEERSLESARRLLSLISPRQAVLIKYPKPGKGADIIEITSGKVEDIRIVEYEHVVSRGLELPNVPALVDVTGLAKPALFSAVRGALQRKGRVWICHTRAEQYYPLDVDIAKVLDAEKSRDHYQLLNSLSEILTGEKGPYTIDGLLESDADESRRKVLCTFASAKHERLLSLLDARDYDRLEIIVPPKGTPRSEIARIAAEIAGWNFRASGTTEIRSDDLHGVIDELMRQYLYWYVERGYNIEFGLTGSKMQAVACAAVSVECKIAQCWYVRPKEFDPKRFTKGIGESRYFSIWRGREGSNYCKER